MNLKKYKDNLGRTMISPSDEEDMPIFKHCSDGCISVTETFFEEALEDILFLHGVSFIRITGEDHETHS